MLTSVVASSAEADTTTAIVGASAAIAGLVLVFAGILVTSYQALLGRASEAILGRFRTSAWLTLGVFALALLSLALGVIRLDAGSGHTLYVLVLVLFFVELAALAVTAFYVTWRVLLRS